MTYHNKDKISTGRPGEDRKAINDNWDGIFVMPKIKGVEIIPNCPNCNSDMVGRQEMDCRIIGYECVNCGNHWKPQTAKMREFAEKHFFNNQTGRRK